MSTEPQEVFRVRFLPDNVVALVPRGTTILQAARQAGVYLNSICGGDGVCGKCRVIVQKGLVQSPPTTLLTRQEVMDRMVLACQAEVAGDVEVFVPEETRAGEGRILLDEDAQRFGLLAARGPVSACFAHDPLVRKYYLDMTPPSLGDSTSDHGRVYDAIRTQSSDTSEMQTGYGVLRTLPAILQAANYKVTATVAWRRGVRELVQIEPGDTSQRLYGVAVDVGTTTVVANLIDLRTAAITDARATYNSQMKYGEDYIARIMYMRQHNALDEMQRLIVEDINNLIAALVQDNNVSLNDVIAVMCAGNTAMIHFLAGLDPTRIQKSPYVPVANRIPPLRAAQVGIRINGRGLLYTLPSVAAYIGADIVAGATAVRFDRIAETSLYVDIGTNGEVLVGNRDWMVCCSASAGPAFEGSGVRHGMRAARGAIEKVRIAPGTQIEIETIGGTSPRGICGSGLLDALAELLRTGVIDRAGTLRADHAHGRVREGEDGLEFLLVPAEQTAIGRDIVITQADIRNLIRSKAAIYAAIAVLIEMVGLRMKDLQQVFVAGGFGNYMDIRNAICIGLLPDMPVEHIRFVGNGSLAGARMALLSREAYLTAEEIARRMTYQDLMHNNRFMEEFVSASFLPHTNIERFPSLSAELRAAGHI